LGLIGHSSFVLRHFREKHLLLKTGRICGLVAVALCVGCASQEGERGPPWATEAEHQHPWGFYSGSPETRWNPDGRTMTLLTELRYTDPNGVIWIAPAGSVVDGASIPRSLWSIMGGPFEGKYRNASVLHDVAYEEHNRPWPDCDRMFYNAMRCSGVGAVEAKTMYYSLYKFGHHWKFPIRRGKAVRYKGETVARAEEIPRAVPVDRDQISDARDWIRDTDPSLEAIERRADAEQR
jgi:hypothetical protein